LLARDGRFDRLPFATRQLLIAIARRFLPFVGHMPVPLPVDSFKMMPSRASLNSLPRSILVLLLGSEQNSERATSGGRSWLRWRLRR
jgi:hypothetical protein